MSRPLAILVRAAAIAAALALWFWTQRLIGRKAPAGQGVGDRLHDMTGPLHAWLTANPRAANATLILTSAFIDLFGLYLIGATILGPTVRPFAAMLMLFALRQLCQALCSLPPPRGAIWRHPGIPSLLVTYGVNNDFFFSGHTAIALLGAMELGRAGPPWLAAAAAIIAALEAAAVIVLRAHYLMDVVAAAFIAWGCEAAAGRIAPEIDEWLRRLI
jgi:membrane-associated phospholipid phosphatase